MTWGQTPSHHTYPDCLAHGLTRGLRITGLAFLKDLALSLQEKMRSLPFTVFCDLNASLRIRHLLYLQVVQWAFAEMKIK